MPNKANDITLVLGGCRSGKSRHALELAHTDGDRPLMLARQEIPHRPAMLRRVLQLRLCCAHHRGAEQFRRPVPGHISLRIDL